MTFPIYLLLLNVKLIWSFCMHTFSTSLYNEVGEIFNGKIVRFWLIHDVESDIIAKCMYHFLKKEKYIIR
ncbi:hypothetical protein COA08_01795 [Bacillus cereus]|uniref:Uncharacterized protein n=1 Tax=Bacillus cereus TaxID=1396 RepID=A0A2B8TAL6_BACCE|nr:hypothetical protein CON06_00520 [Bacillus cereus]PFA03595.1 hypothetical protein CN382_28810 [Bacillus cereus]PFM37146.1 hypothetical protein COJ43_20125 [Bacillus cereus]PGL61856.1 hypothetical protein CN927_11315 [Bacillus cereus]PGQ12052.1 hypothetical protein COA08_01795 [Bacillus cereus]